MAQDWFGALFDPYFNRQGKIAQESAAFAEAGRKNWQEGGNPWGLGQQALGTAGWAMSPLSAIVPHELADNSSIPEGAKPAVRGMTDFADFFTPGPNEFMAPAQAISLLAARAPAAQLKHLPEYLKGERELLDAKTPAEAAQIRDALFERTGFDRPYRDLQLRWELPDTGAKLRHQQALNAAPVGQSLTDPGAPYLQTTFDSWLDHPNGLFDIMPELRDIPVGIRKVANLNEVGQGAYYRSANPAERKIQLHVAPNAIPEDIINLLLHEGGHAAQDAGGLFLPLGDINKMDAGDPRGIAERIRLAGDLDPRVAQNQAWQIYTNLAKEVEARNNQERYWRFFAPGRDSELARGTALSNTLDVPFEDQILYYHGGDPRITVPASPKLAPPPDIYSWTRTDSGKAR